ncbi:MAG: carbohydrate kinase [Planctomycetes bacterium]|nr:carbohydrate kinase [Planctomycetota bacterium]
MMTLRPDRLRAITARFPGLTLGLLGDLFLDRYLDIDPSIRETSIETGLPAHQVVAVRNAAGALGTVLNNLAALQVGRIVPVTVIGEDGHGDDLMRCLEGLPVERAHILRRADRLTPTYIKPLQRVDSGSVRELERLDVRTRAPLGDDAHGELADRLERLFGECDGWIVLDQVPERDMGVVDARMRRVLFELARRRADRLVLIDSRKRLGEFEVGSPKGNRHEFADAAGSRDASNASAAAAARDLARRMGRAAYCTLGEDGMLVVRPDGASLRAGAIRVAGPIDIVGAGDAATSGLAAALLAGADDWEAAVVGNLASSITIEQIGTTGVATPDELHERLESAGCPPIERLS